MSNSTRTLTTEDKKSLYRDGYIVVKKAVSDDLVNAALAALKIPKQGQYLGNQAVMTNLVNRSDITPVLHEVMGYFDPPSVCQTGILVAFASLKTIYQSWLSRQRHAVLRCGCAHGRQYHHRSTARSAGRHAGRDLPSSFRVRTKGRSRPLTRGHGS